jgi:hypothetical protein
MDISIINTFKEQGGQYLSNVATKVGQISWTSPSWDLFLLAIFVAIVILFMFSLSREKIFNTLISSYIALAAMKSFDGLIKIWSLGWLWQILIFLIFFVIISALVSRLSIGAGSGLANLLQVFYFSILQTGFLMTIIISFFPKEIISQLYPITKVAFVDNVAKNVWFFLPLLSLVFIRKR